MNKKGRLSIKQLISLILVLIVIVVVLLAIFNPSLFDWVRQLPDYSYNDTDRPIDLKDLTAAETEGICPGASRVGFVGELSSKFFSEQYLVFFDEKGDGVRTKFYWRRGENNGKIWLLQGDRDSIFEWLTADRLVAEVVDNKIKVKEEWFDLDSEIHQKARFSEKSSEFLNNNLKFLIKLDGSYPAFNNKICKISEDISEEDFKPAWPESIGEEIIELDPKLSVGKKIIIINGLLDFIYTYSTEIKYLYLINKEDYIQVNGYREGWCGDYCKEDKEDILRIYPEDSIWFTNKYKGGTIHGGTNVYDMIDLSDRRKLQEPNLLSRENPYIFRSDAGDYMSETNIKLLEKWNYTKIKEFVDNI